MQPVVSESPTPAAASWRPMTPKRRAIMMAELMFLLVLIGALLAIGSGKIQIDKVISGSMEPTLAIGDVIVSDANAMPSRYDVICLNNPEKPAEKLVKRILGVPGDEIKVLDRILYINKKKEVSDQIMENALAWKDVNIRVPDDAIFVMGDNRNNSYDSLDFGPVPFGQIRGVVWAIVWPPRHWGRPRALH